MAFVAPTNLTDLDDEALNASIDSALEAFGPLAKLKDEELTEDQVAEMEALSGFVQTANSEKQGRAAAAAERSQKLAAIRESMAAKDESDEDNDESEAPAETVVEEEAPVAPEVPAEPVVDEAPAPAEPIETVDEVVIDEEEDNVSNSPALVAGGNKAPLTGRAARNSKAADIDESGPAGTIVAAADVPGFSSGHKFNSLKDAGAALAARLNAYNGLTQRGVRSQHGGLILKTAEKAFNQNDYLGRELEMLMKAGSESRLQGNSLVAAGGWGAPSEQSLDFCSIETTDGLLDLPEVTVTRGGLNFTKGPDFSTVLDSDTGFWDMTEAVAEAGTELKTSLRPELPPFQDVRLDAVGVMVEAGLLLRSAWPELIQRYAELALIAHAHKVSRKSLRQLRAIAGAAVNVASGFGNALDTLHILEVAAQGERQRYAMDLNATLEVIAPLWLKPAIRADLAQRTGVENFLSITDAQIDAFFAARKLRVQWIYTDQSLDVSAGVAVEYPDKVSVTMYPAGTFVRGVTDVITLDTVYDSTNLKKNDYVHLFVEQGTAVVNPCFTARNIDIPLVINGRTAAADLVKNFGTV